MISLNSLDKFSTTVWKIKIIPAPFFNCKMYQYHILNLILIILNQNTFINWVQKNIIASLLYQASALRIIDQWYFFD